MRIYTKTGDGGESSLYTGRRAPKDQAVFEALGDVDEANCAVGSARTAVLEAARGRRREEVGSQEDTSEAPAALAELAEQLSVVQSRLLDVGSAVATPLGEASEYKAARAAFSDGQVRSGASGGMWNLDVLAAPGTSPRDFNPLLRGTALIGADTHCHTLKYVQAPKASVEISSLVAQVATAPSRAQWNAPPRGRWPD